MFPGVRIPEYFVKLYNLIILDKLQYQKETFGSKARFCVHFEKMSFYSADIDHSWLLSFVGFVKIEGGESANRIKIDKEAMFSVKQIVIGHNDDTKDNF